MWGSETTMSNEQTSGASWWSTSSCFALDSRSGASSTPVRSSVLRSWHIIRSASAMALRQASPSAFPLRICSAPGSQSRSIGTPSGSMAVISPLMSLFPLLTACSKCHIPSSDPTASPSAFWWATSTVCRDPSRALRTPARSHSLSKSALYVVSICMTHNRLHPNGRCETFCKDTSFYWIIYIFKKI